MAGSRHETSPDRGGAAGTEGPADAGTMSPVPGVALLAVLLVGGTAGAPMGVPQAGHPAEGTFVAAQAAWSEGRVDDAVAGLRSLVERYPQARYPRLTWRAAARVRLGEIRLRLGELEAAAAELVGVIDEEPASGWSSRARLGLATVWGLQGRHEAAAAVLQEIVSAAEDDEPGADVEAAAHARRRLDLLHRVSVRRRLGLQLWTGSSTLQMQVELDDPVGVAVSSNGDVLITDEGLDQAILRDVEGNVARFDVDDIRRPWWDADGNAWLAAGRHVQRPRTGESVSFVRPERGGQRALEEPLAGATGPGGDWWIVDGDADAVFRFGPGGDHRASLGGPGDPRPVDVALDARGRVFVVDRRGRRVRRHDPDGAFAVLLGLDAWEEPWALDVDALGNLYVLDRDAERIHVLDPDGNPIWALGPALPGGRELRDPRDLAVGPDGRIYVADRDRSVIVVIE